jgi:hypothetical protein
MIIFLKKTNWKLVLVSITGFLLYGCQPAPKNPSRSTLVEDVPQFSASKGLYLPETTQQSLRLSRAEVTEGSVTEQVDVTLGVFGVEGGIIRASGMIAHHNASHVSAGQIVEVSYQNGHVLEARIDRVIHDTVGNSGRMEIIVRMNGIEPFPAVGDFLSGRISLTGKPDSIAIPRNALLECSEGTFVFAISGDRFVRTAVQVGRKDKESVEIVDGLYTGDEVVTHPVQSLWMTELAAVKGGQSCCLVSPEDQ